MKPELTLILATAGLAVGVYYAWWIKIRVWLLREDLFVLRDSLWDYAMDHGLLKDERYRRAREGINALIRVAPALSLFTVFHILKEEKREPGVPAREEDATIDAAIEEAVNRVAHYLFYQTASGFIVGLPLLLVHWKHSVQQRFACMLRRFFESAELQAVSWKVNQQRGMAAMGLHL